MVIQVLKKSYSIIKKDGIHSFFNRAWFKLQHKFPIYRITPQKSKVDYKIKVLYIIGCIEGESKRYRVFNLIEALKAEQVYGEWKYEIDLQLKDDAYINQFDSIIIFRGAYSPCLSYVINKAKELRIPTVFDVDDLVFDESIIDSIDGLQQLTEVQQEEYRDGVKRYTKTLIECDYGTCSTAYLAQRMKAKGKTAYVIANSINKVQIDYAEKASYNHYDDKIVIGYMSGSNTHNRDFQQIVRPLKRILSEHPNVVLRITGYLNIEEHLPEYKKQIEKRPFTAWEQLVQEMSELDINLAPLELDNPFCEGKSELKYFEAALVNVPTIASKTDTFSKCIIHKKNGMLCENEEEWYTSIKELIEDKALYHHITRNAKQHIQQVYYPEVIAKQCVEVYSHIIEDYKIRNLKMNQLNIVWIVPEPFEASGGHRNIFRTIKYLSKFGHNLKVYIEPNTHRFTSDKHVEEFITKNFMDLGAQIILGTDNIVQCDVLFATHWTTAYVVKKNSIKSLTQCYFIQDYEPYFYEMGYEYILANNTYQMGLQHITSGPWCTHLIEREFNVKSNYFRFPIDRNIYYNCEKSKGNHEFKIIYFARPDMPRRCYPLGVEALSIIKKKYPECEIVFYGANKEKYVNIPFEFTNLGMLPRIEDLGDLYRSADLGMAFSTTNPSLVPFEMMACGCPVVDLDVNNNEVNYGGRDNVMLVNSTPESIAQGIEEIIENRELREKIITQGLEYCNIFPSEEEMVKIIEGFIKQGLMTKCNKEKL